MNFIKQFWDARIANWMPNFRDPARAAKRFARKDLDEVFKLSAYDNMSALYQHYTEQAFAKGEKPNYFNQARSFIFYIRKEVYSLEGAEDGTISLLKQRIETISENTFKVNKKLEFMKGKLEKGEYNALVENVHDTWQKIHKEIEFILADVLKLHRNLENDRNQLITSAFRFDFSFKRSLAFFFQNQRTLKKLENGLFSKIHKDVQNLSTMHSKSAISGELNLLHKSINEDMLAIKNELRDLTILLIALTKNFSTLELAVLDSLRKSGLSKTDLDIIQGMFDSLREEIKEKAGVEAERTKQLIPIAGRI